MKCFIFIDGSNFYKGSKNLINDKTISLLKLDYLSFFNFLCADDEYVGANYYIGAIQRTDKKSHQLYSGQQRLIAMLQTYSIPTILGTVIKHPDGSFHEKGVDVRLAVEMIRLARTQSYDKAILISSDTDLVPAVEEIKSLGKTVKYIGFPQNQSYGLTKASNEYIILRKNDLMSCFPSTLFNHS
jgi:uncharacterized LabA/DUF88 family protein